MSASVVPAATLSPSLAERVRPVALAGERLLPVHEALSSVLALPGLVRGTTVAVGGSAAATSLAVALATRASMAGSWVAVVGLPPLGLTAAEGLGLALERVVLVAPPEPGRWAAVLATLVEGFDVVLAGPPVRVRPADARRLVARLRERRSVLVQVGWPPGRWAEEPELALAARQVHWEGIGQGWGACRARRVEVELRGRRGAGRPRRGWLWLPGPDGRLAAADEGGDGVGAAPVGVAVGPGEGPMAVPERPRLNLVPDQPARGRRRSSGGRRPPGPAGGRPVAGGRRPPAEPAGGGPVAGGGRPPGPAGGGPVAGGGRPPAEPAGGGAATGEARPVGGRPAAGEGRPVGGRPAAGGRR